MVNLLVFSPKTVLYELAANLRKIGIKFEKMHKNHIYVLFKEL